MKKPEKGNKCVFCKQVDWHENWCESKSDHELLSTICFLLERINNEGVATYEKRPKPTQDGNHTL